MENSGKILFENDASQWYVSLGDRWIGPMSASDIYEKINLNQLTLAHYVWKQGQSNWRRICDTKTFQTAVPSMPHVKPVIRQAGGVAQTSGNPSPRTSKGSVPGARSASSSVVLPVFQEEKSLHVKCWYLYYQDSQFGPFSEAEMKRFLKIGKIHSRVHAWKEGMKTWERIERIEAFRSQSIEEEPKGTSEQRNNPRRPLIAKILMSDEQSVIVGVCRDISIGGLQVLCERVPGKAGTHLKMNISPSSQDSGKQVNPFLAAGVIVRVLEDGRGFSFRFEKLSDRARQTIEAYIESPL